MTPIVTYVIESPELARRGRRRRRFKIVTASIVTVALALAPSPIHEIDHGAHRIGTLAQGIDR